MRTTERSVVYSALALLGAMNVVFLLSHGGRAAFAEARSYLADVLGPAEAVKLVDGEKEIEVKAKSGRMTWGSGDFRQTYSVGFVDISKALNPLMEAPALVEERKSLAEELDAKEKEYQDRLDVFRGDIEGKDPKDPAVQEAIKQAQGVYQEYMDWGRSAVERRNAMDVKQMQAAYKELTSAVDVVADKLGVDIVLRFIPAENEFKAKDAEGALTEIRLRTAVKAPAALDITTEVLEELDVQDNG